MPPAGKTPLLGVLLMLQRWGCSAGVVALHTAQSTGEGMVTVLMRVLYALLGGRVWAEQRHRSFWHFVGILHMRAFEVGFAPYAVWRQVRALPLHSDGTGLRVLPYHTHNASHPPPYARRARNALDRISCVRRL
jgi:hypothetical protein